MRASGCVQVGQWESELRTKAAGANLRVHRWYDTGRERDAARLAEYDVVLTTYDTAGMAWGLAPSRLKASQRAAEEARDRKLEVARGNALLGGVKEKEAFAKLQQQAPKKQRAGAEPTLEKIAWHRLILDEARHSRTTPAGRRIPHRSSGAGRCRFRLHCPASDRNAPHPADCAALTQPTPPAEPGRARPEDVTQRRV